MGPNADIYKFGNCKLTIDRGKLKFLGETAVTVCLCRTWNPPPVAYASAVKSRRLRVCVVHCHVVTLNIWHSWNMNYILYRGNFFSLLQSPGGQWSPAISLFSLLPSTHLWLYSSFRALASLIRRLHSSLFAPLLLYPLIPSSCSASLWTTSPHLVLGLPTGLVVWKFPFRTFIGILSSYSVCYRVLIPGRQAVEALRRPFLFTSVKVKNARSCISISPTCLRVAHMVHCIFKLPT